MSVLLTVVKAGSFSAAARELGVPVANVSRKIAELERHLNTGILIPVEPAHDADRRGSLLRRGLQADPRRDRGGRAGGQRRVQRAEGPPDGDRAGLLRRLHLLPVALDPPAISQHRRPAGAQRSHAGPAGGQRRAGHPHRQPGGQQPDRHPAGGDADRGLRQPRLSRRARPAAEAGGFARPSLRHLRQSRRAGGLAVRQRQGRRPGSGALPADRQHGRGRHRCRPSPASACCA